MITTKTITTWNEFKHVNHGFQVLVCVLFKMSYRMKEKNSEKGTKWNWDRKEGKLSKKEQTIIPVEPFSTVIGCVTSFT